MALRQNKPISRIADSTLTPEDKLRINQKAQEQGEPIIFPFERDEKKVFQFSEEIRSNLQVSEKKSDLRKKIVFKIDKHISSTEFLRQNILKESYWSNFFIYYTWSTKDLIIINTKEAVFYVENILHELKEIKKILYKEWWSDSFVSEEVLEYIGIPLWSKMTFLAKIKGVNNESEVRKISATCTHVCSMLLRDLETSFLRAKENTSAIRKISVNIAYNDWEFLKDLETYSSDNNQIKYKIEKMIESSKEFRFFIKNLQWKINDLSEYLFLPQCDRDDSYVDEDILILLKSKNKLFTILKLYKQQSNRNIWL